jgi:hypothetical protein
MRREDASIGELFDVYLVYFLNHPDDPPHLYFPGNIFIQITC